LEGERGANTGRARGRATDLARTLADQMLELVQKPDHLDEVLERLTAEAVAAR
jgi:hypothetical protein